MIRSFFRVLAFTSNWRALVWRQPAMLLTMIAGPFLVLLLFGIGNTIYEAPPKTIVVNLASDPQFQISPQDLSSYLDVIEVTNNLEQAVTELQQRRVRLVLVVPDRPLETVQSGRRVQIRALINEIDPVALAFAQIDVRTQMAEVNAKIQERLIESMKPALTNAGNFIDRIPPILLALTISQDDLKRARQSIDTIMKVPADVLATPFEAKLENITPVPATPISYFVPAAIALIIQHLAVTLAGLSMVRARLLRTMRLWQTAPVRLGEIIAGNYISYGVLMLVASVVLVLLLVWALSLPVLGPMFALWAGVVLLIFASLGYGFVISILAKNEQTAAQMTMIILLASLFLGGFIRSLDAIILPVRVFSYLLPATYGGQILQDIMLRGLQGNIVYYSALAVIGVLGLASSVSLLGRELKPG